MRLGASLLAGSSGHVADCPDLGPGCGTATPPTPFHHHVDLVSTDVSLDLSYGLAPWLAAELRLGLRIVDTKPSYTELDGSPKSVPDDPHHHDRTIVGPTDPWLVFRFAAARGRLVTAARLGVTLPIGATEPNPYALGAEGRWHEHTQLGAGTFMPIVGLGAMVALGPIELDVSALGFFSLYENSEGFRAPSRAFASVRVTLPLADGAIRPYVSGDVSRETAEVWDGMTGMESGEQTQILVGGGLAWRFSDPWTLDAGVRVRAASFSETAGYDYPAVFQLGLSTHFDLAEAKRE